MENNELFTVLKDALIGLNQDAVIANTRKGLEAGTGPLEIIENGLLPGLNTIGEQFENEEIFLPELMQSAMIVQAAMEILHPEIKKTGATLKKKGVVVLGTVKGDVHSIGKNILKLLMETSGFDVYDLGVDVDPFALIRKADEVNADIIALSALLTTTLVGQKDVIEALEEQGTRDKYKVMVGGGAVTQEWADKITADGYAENAYGAVEKASELVS
jgi:corrinoid protein of di/trimethylamine methyltransferase